jgi:hypothetical protein
MALRAGVAADECEQRSGATEKKRAHGVLRSASNCQAAPPATTATAAAATPTTILARAGITGAADRRQQIGPGNVAHCQCSASSRRLSGTEEPGCGLRSDNDAIDGCHPDAQANRVESNARP